ncbi:hypothetical protein MFRU_031g00290 [Monilinia fructicola]|nr:hypothetical protein MFRU_031g00290 [Monilinia fructicola]
MTGKKDVEGLALWSPWEWDNNGCWIASRISSSGTIEYRYQSPSEATYHSPSSEAGYQCSVPEARSAIDHTPAQANPSYANDHFIPYTQNLYSNDGQYAKEGPQITSTSAIPTYWTLENSTPHSPSSLTTTSPHAAEYSTRGGSTTNRAPQSNKSNTSLRMKYRQNCPICAGKIPTDNTGYRMPKLSTNVPNDSWILDATLQSDNMKDIGDTLASMNSSSIETGKSGSDSISESLDTLDSRYRVIDQPSRFFSIGRVFMMLWTEPARQEFPSGGSSHYSTTYLGGQAFSGIRRFVVVANGGRGNAICCPIHTYSGRGTSKPNLSDKNMHAAAYSHTEEPQLLAEEELMIEPFPIIVEDAEAKIHPMSRINFSKVYTVEYYVRVCNIGRVDASHIGRLLEVSPVKCQAAIPKKNPRGKKGHQKHKAPKKSVLNSSPNAEN